MFLFCTLLVDLLNMFCKYKWYFIYHYLSTRKPKLGGLRKDWNRRSALGTVAVDEFVYASECACVCVCVCVCVGFNMRVLVLMRLCKCVSECMCVILFTVGVLSPLL